MADTVLQWLYYFGAIVCMVSVGEWTYHWTNRDIKRWLFAGVIYALGFTLGIVMFSDRLLYVNLFFIAEILAWSLICEEKFTVRITRIVALMFVVGIIENIMSIVIEVMLGEAITWNGNKVGSIALTFFAFAVITRMKWYQSFIAYLGSLSKWKRIMILCAIVLGVAVAAFGSVVQEMLNNRTMTVFFRVLIVIDLIVVTGIIGWLIVESYQKKYYEEQNDIKEAYICMQQDYYKIIYDKDQEIRRFRHDVESQMGVVRVLLERGEVESAKMHLHSVYQEFSLASFRKIRVGNEMLDTILSMMNQRAAEKGVELQIKGEIKGTIGCDVYELCTILSNAIGNAIEACVSVQKDNIVLLKILEHNHSFSLVIQNAATEEMYQVALKGETTKEDKGNHGYGVRNIRRAVERLNGSMEYRYMNGELELEINI